MLFQTFDYFLFLPLVAVVHWALGRGRTAWLLIASLIFYVAWNPKDFLVLAAVTGVAYGGGLLLSRRPAWMPAVVLALLAPLFWFKYAHFVTANLAILIPGLPVLPPGHLPIGISFYTFQAIGYVVDTRRGQEPERSPMVFSSFLLFFPHLVAGPILRAHNLIGQLRADRSLSAEDIGEGITRLSRGLVKKLLIADVLSVGIVETVILEPERFTGPEVMLALYAYTLQIYCDFSGYTDLAIGSARLLGFKIPENFRRPYQALSVGDYWRRWHITLSDWVRDYVTPRRPPLPNPWPPCDRASGGAHAVPKANRGREATTGGRVAEVGSPEDPLRAGAGPVRDGVFPLDPALRRSRTTAPRVHDRRDRPRAACAAAAGGGTGRHRPPRGGPVGL